MCVVPILSLDDDSLSDDDVIPVQNGCAVGDEYHERVDVNYMVVKFTCQGRCLPLVIFELFKWLVKPFLLL